jgi:hypothetical protein
LHYTIASNNLQYFTEEKTQREITETNEGVADISKGRSVDNISAAGSPYIGLRQRESPP